MTTRPLMLLDTAALYFRAFYGVPDSFRAPDGTPVNAARGLVDMIARLATTYRPERVVACWDDDWRPQWRVDLIPTYKTHRVAQARTGAPDEEIVPDPLEQQIPIIREALDALGVAIVGAPEHEADDVIATLAARSESPVDIVTGDRDLFQLVDDDRTVQVVYTARGMSNLEIVTDDVIVKKYGVHAHQYADYAALRGDASDGLPGVAGVGEKTAAALLSEFEDLAGILDAAERGVGMKPAVRAKILDALPYLAVAPRVVRTVTDLDLSVPAARPIDDENLRALGERWGISTSLGRAREALAALGADG